MIASISAFVLGTAVLASALPTMENRAVTQLNEAAFEEAQRRDNTATRALTATSIKTSTGQCLFTDILSGDFRANLTPIQVAACDGSKGQQWDVISKGVHNNVAGAVLIVNTLTQACMNFDPRRAAGNQVILFSCGGRADGDGKVTDSQLFNFAGGAAPLTLSPKNAVGTCFTVKGNVIDQAACSAGNANQAFTFGSAGAAPAPAASSAAAPVAAPSAVVPAAPSKAPLATKVAEPPVACSLAAPAPAPVVSSVIAPEAPASSAAAPAASVSSAVAPVAPAPTAAPAAPAAGAILSVNPTTPVPVSRAGGILNPSNAAESHQRDATATRAFSSVSLKSANGQCLFINPTAGDFRQNLIPVSVKPCDGSPNEKFDFITAGKHNDGSVPGAALIVSTLTQGCLNFDSRRAAGDTVILFSCGGRADGDSKTTDSQLFPLVAGSKSVLLAPANSKGAICLSPKGDLLDSGACTGNANQLFTIE